MTRDDLENIYLLRSHPKVNLHIKRSPPASIKEAEVFIERITKGIAEESLLFWVIVPKGETELVGSICLWNFSNDKKVAELGYDLLPEHQRKGIMAESVQAVLEFGFRKLELDSIEAFTHLENQRSVKLLKRNGFMLDPNRRDENDKENRVFQLRNI